jgi:hypothetical protein
MQAVIKRRRAFQKSKSTSLISPCTEELQFAISEKRIYLLLNTLI